MNAYSNTLKVVTLSVDFVEIGGSSFDLSDDSSYPDVLREFSNVFDISSEDVLQKFWDSSDIDTQDRADMIRFLVLACADALERGLASVILSSDVFFMMLSIGANSTRPEFFKRFNVRTKFSNVNRFAELELSEDGNDGCPRIDVRPIECKLRFD